ncbi:hypothetical protein LY76DRAFT_77603 [Colletotrichum caudatum]|nr:hypothetical protein LY76DRAFT_77603 [Colletotrichum caudatum]
MESLRTCLIPPPLLHTPTHRLACTPTQPIEEDGGATSTARGWASTPVQRKIRASAPGFGEAACPKPAARGGAAELRRRRHDAPGPDRPLRACRRGPVVWGGGGTEWCTMHILVCVFLGSVETSSRWEGWPVPMPGIIKLKLKGRHLGPPSSVLCSSIAGFRLGSSTFDHAHFPPTDAATNWKTVRMSTGSGPHLAEPCRLPPAACQLRTVVHSSQGKQHTPTTYYMRYPPIRVGVRIPYRSAGPSSAISCRNVAICCDIQCADD